MKTKKTKKSKGFTLVEILFALFIGGLLVSAIYFVLISGQKSSVGIERKVAAQGDVRAALEILSGSNAYSRAMDVKGRKMVERDFTVQARLSQHLKDVHLMLDAARAVGLSLPLTETHRRLMEEAEAAGLGEQDNSAIIEVLRKPEAGPAS